MSNRRFVFDTNVVVSALLLKGSTARRVFDRALALGVLLLSAKTLSELNDVLRREKFDKYLAEDERLRFLAALVRESMFVETDSVITVCRDPKDDKFLEVAVDGGAECVISGDADLLELHPFRGIAILSPGDFWEKNSPTT